MALFRAIFTKSETNKYAFVLLYGFSRWFWTFLVKIKQIDETAQRM